MQDEPVGFEEPRAGLGGADRTSQSELVDMLQHPLAQDPEQPEAAGLRAQVGVAQAHAVGALFEADEAEDSRVAQAAKDEPAVVGAVAQRIATAFAPHLGAGEETAHAGEKRRFVVERPPLEDLAVPCADHVRFFRSASRRSTSAWA